MLQGNTTSNFMALDISLKAPRRQEREAARALMGSCGGRAVVRCSQLGAGSAGLLLALPCL